MTTKENIVSEFLAYVLDDGGLVESDYLYRNYVGYYRIEVKRWRNLPEVDVIDGAIVGVTIKNAVQVVSSDAMNRKVRGLG